MLRGGPHVSRERIRRDLRSLGLESGMTVIVHSSLSSIGRVDGGAATVVSALLDVLGASGTLVMPAATPRCAGPSENADRDLLQRVPLFDLRETPTSLGAIPEAFRKWPGTLRSDHPLESVCARGPSAAAVTGEHPLAFSEGRGGPFDKLHALESRILLLGVGFNRCTALHYAESLVDKRRVTRVRFVEEIAGRRQWVEVPNVADDNDTHFPIIGDRYLAAGRAARGLVGAAPSMLVVMGDLVELATAYFDETL